MSPGHCFIAPWATSRLRSRCSRWRAWCSGARIGRRRVRGRAAPLSVIGAMAFTAWSEWYNVYRAGNWGYTASMPLVFGIGFSPLLQWLILPPVWWSPTERWGRCCSAGTTRAARFQHDSTERPEMKADLNHSHPSHAHAHRHAGSTPSGAAPVASSTRYTCPMHPEIVRDAPGSCPKCGMTLVPIAGTGGGETYAAELRDLTRRLWVGGRACRAPRCATSARTSRSLSATTRSASRLPLNNLRLEAGGTTDWLL